jgi:hypothetical protein
VKGVEQHTPCLLNFDPRLLNFDYDGTAFNTGEPAPGGGDIDAAYAPPIAEYIGQAAADDFLENGGHRHRTPTEIVHSLVPDARTDQLERLSDKITQGKLEILMGWVGLPLPDGTQWPRPIDGFTDTWEAIYAARQKGQPIGTAVISAGHTRFEQKTFDIHDLPQPDIYLTEDVMKGLALNLPLEDQVKPSPFLTDITRLLFSQRLRRTHPHLRDTPIDQIHIGDDPIKDLRLARNSHIDFVLVEKNNPAEAWKKVADWLQVGSMAVKGASSG